MAKEKADTEYDKFKERTKDDGAAYDAHINELLRSLNVNGEEEAQPADTEQTED